MFIFRFVREDGADFFIIKDANLEQNAKIFYIFARKS